MRIADRLPYRYADAVLGHSDFKALYDDIVEIFEAAPVPLLNPDLGKGKVKSRTRKGLKDAPGRRVFMLPVNQKALNTHLEQAFEARGWDTYPYVVDPARQEGPKTRLKADFKKERLQVEVQFGNMARWYSDVFKFQLSYSQDLIGAAVLVVPTQRFANLIDENVAYFERVARELPHAKMSLTLPILVLGIEPEDWEPVRACYDKAAETFIQQQAAANKTFVAIPFEERWAEEPTEEEEEEEALEEALPAQPAPASGTDDADIAGDN